jgi:2Fe-2S ferredoxin
VGDFTLHVTDREGHQSTHRLPAEGPLMFLLRDHAGLPVEGLCGGCASCGTCHVYVDPAWAGRLPAPEAHEEGMLEMLDHRQEGASRLACQIEASPELDGLLLTLAPQE